ncbi:MAG: hypothetical protein RMK84_02375 [Oscillochloridaceae bacterium]|nr:hypothetical protein [Chloroflexaceae bacterium]MDW8388949.1 hypothetical protein [Oscillochloridaceae bacterium]
MSQSPNDGLNPNDPIGTWRTIRDANLDAWAKGMAALVNTEVFANAIGLQLDTILAASAPIRQAVNQYMETYLAQINMPSRAEVINLASRLTNIEMRLDDMQVQLDEVLEAVRGLALVASANGAVATEEAGMGEAEITAKPRRTRKPAAES